LARYSALNGYTAECFADASCRCGAVAFRLLLADAEGVAVRTCLSCGAVQPIADGDDYLDNATLGECECPCGHGEFQISVGVALYADSIDVRWLYLGCRCTQCGLIATYGDWKNEHEDYRELLKKI
jgi:hypothetical protein